MNELDLRDLLPPERGLPPARREAMRQRLLAEIQHEAQVSRRRYRLLAGLLAAVLLVVAGLVAVYAAGSSEDSTDNIPSGQDMRPVPRPGGEDDGADVVPVVPDPSDAERVLEQFAQLGASVADNQRIGLDAERIFCVARGTAPVSAAPEQANARISHFPLEERLTADLLIQQCMGGSDWNGTDDTGLDQGEASACVANPVSDYPLAVVALNGLGCEEVGDGVEVRPMTQEDLDELNRMRAVEVALLAGPPGPCPTEQELGAWVEQVTAESGDELPWESEADGLPVTAGGFCSFGAFVHWQYDNERGAGVVIDQWVDAASIGSL